MLNLAQMRKMIARHGLTQTVIAQRAGIAQSRVSAALSGEVDTRLSTWRKIEAAVKAGSSTGNAVSSVENVEK